MTKEFWKDTMERALYTVAETALGVLGACSVLDQVNWKVLVSSSALSGVVTVLKCIAIRGRSKEEIK